MYFIAEAGVNHNGDEKTAFTLVDIAVAAGADAVKFQLFDPKSLVTHSAVTAAYQAENLGDHAISQQDMLTSLVLPEGALVRLCAYCKEKNIDFICTPFDSRSLAYLLKHTPMRYLKLPSGEVTNAPFLLECARSGLPIILSTGMSNLEEISIALGVLYHGYRGIEGPPPLTPAKPQMCEFLKDRITLLHCTSQYPAPPESLNLKAMQTMREHFGLNVGYSDHSLGITASVAAASLGAEVIEKHITYNTKAHGPDHAASLPPEVLNALVKSLRQVAIMLGSSEKTCQSQEKDTRDIARKSLVAAQEIEKGQLVTDHLLTCKRPGTGLSPTHYWQVLGKPAKRDYAADTLIETDELNR